MATAYIFSAALLCRKCGEAACKALAPTEDSETYPQGPYTDGGGEADCPQHCDTCGRFLANPLTGDGEAYVLAALAEGRGDPGVLATWRDHYSHLELV